MTVDRRIPGALMGMALLELRQHVSEIARRILTFRGVLLCTTALRGTDYRRAPAALGPAWYSTQGVGATHLQPGASVVIDNHHVQNVGGVPLALTMGRR